MSEEGGAAWRGTYNSFRFVYLAISGVIAWSYRRLSTLPASRPGAAILRVHSSDGSISTKRHDSPAIGGATTRERERERE